MAFLQPAIAALRSGKAERLREFDDLLYGTQYRHLQKLLGIEEDSTDTSADTNTELDEVVQTIDKRVKARDRRKKARVKTNQVWSEELPVIDPLVK
jgi:hypothetical protein